MAIVGSEISVEYNDGRKSIYPGHNAVSTQMFAEVVWGKPFHVLCTEGISRAVLASCAWKHAMAAGEDVPDDLDQYFLSLKSVDLLPIEDDEDEESDSPLEED